MWSPSDFDSPLTSVWSLSDLGQPLTSDWLLTTCDPYLIPDRPRPAFDLWVTANWPLLTCYLHNWSSGFVSGSVFDLWLTCEWALNVRWLPSEPQMTRANVPVSDLWCACGIIVTVLFYCTVSNVFLNIIIRHLRCWVCEQQLRIICKGCWSALSNSTD